MVAAAYFQGPNWETDVSLPIYPLRHFSNLSLLYAYSSQSEVTDKAVSFLLVYLQRGTNLAKMHLILNSVVN
jgi:hypothetical protein